MTTIPISSSQCSPGRNFYMKMVCMTQRIRQRGSSKASYCLRYVPVQIPSWRHGQRFVADIPIHLYFTKLSGVDWRCGRTSLQGTTNFWWMSDPLWRGRPSKDAANWTTSNCIYCCSGIYIVHWFYLAVRTCWYDVPSFAWHSRVAVHGES